MVLPLTTTWLMRGPVSKRWIVINFLPGEWRLLLAQSEAARHCANSSGGLMESSDRLRRRAPRVASRKQTPAEERPFQGAIAVHAAAAETGGFARRIEALDDFAVGAEHARVEIGLKAAQRLAGQDVQLHGDQRPMRGIEDPVRLCGADQLVADIAARIVQVHHLRILDESVVDLAVARLDLRLDGIELEQI